MTEYNKVARIMTPTESYVTVYPQFIEFADMQLEKCFWLASEIDVQKDKQNLWVDLTNAQRHAVSTALKLFVKYELFVGNEYWNSRVVKVFPRPEIQRMASVFGMFELAVHAPFYNKLNEVLGLDTDHFYESYVDDPVLKDRMDFLDNIVDDDDDLLSVAVFSLVEGAVLYSSFALFKSFQAQGQNNLPNVVAGINQSLIDEGVHNQAGAALFQTAIGETNPSPEYKEKLFEKIIEAAKTIYEHEALISEKFFEKGGLPGITCDQLKLFAKSRVDICLSLLGIPPIYNVKEEDNKIAEWFYKSATAFQSIDFFQVVGREYQRGWDAKKFVWKVEG